MHNTTIDATTDIIPPAHTNVTRYFFNPKAIKSPPIPQPYPSTPPPHEVGNIDSFDIVGYNIPGAPQPHHIPPMPQLLPCQLEGKTINDADESTLTLLDNVDIINIPQLSSSKFGVKETSFKADN